MAAYGVEVARSVKCNTVAQLAERRLVRGHRKALWGD